MPKKVFKCDYCYGEFFDTEDEALKHEHDCDYNEDNKRCGTCEHYKEMGYPIGGSDMQCQNKNCPMFDKNVGYFLEDKNEDKYFPCNYWEKEK